MLAGLIMSLIFIATNIYLCYIVECKIIKAKIKNNLSILGLTKQITPEIKNKIEIAIIIDFVYESYLLPPA